MSFSLAQQKAGQLSESWMKVERAWILLESLAGESGPVKQFNPLTVGGE